jgi:hypothetical protein
VTLRAALGLLAFSLVVLAITGSPAAVAWVGASLALVGVAIRPQHR